MSFKFQWSETMDTRFERFQRRMGAAFVSQEVPLIALEHSFIQRALKRECHALAK